MTRSESIVVWGGEGRGGERRVAQSKGDGGVDSAKSVIKVESRRGHEWSAGNFSESASEIIVVDIVVIVINCHQIALVDIGMPMPGCNVDSRAYIGFLVGIIKARGRTVSRGTQTGAVIRCLTF